MKISSTKYYKEYLMKLIDLENNIIKVKKEYIYLKAMNQSV